MYLIRRQIYIIILIAEQFPIIFIMEKYKIKRKQSGYFLFRQEFIRLVIYPPLSDAKVAKPHAEQEKVKR